MHEQFLRFTLQCRIIEERLGFVQGDDKERHDERGHALELNQRGNRRTGIRKIHGTTGGNTWAVPEKDAISMILGARGATYAFWVVGSASRAVRVVVTGTYPDRVLKTEADGVGENNLLSLPEWPWAA